jgi:hypothetical protein
LQDWVESEKGDARASPFFAKTSCASRSLIFARYEQKLLETTARFFALEIFVKRTVGDACPYKLAAV